MAVESEKYLATEDIVYLLKCTSKESFFFKNVERKVVIYQEYIDLRSEKNTVPFFETLPEPYLKLQLGRNIEYTFPEIIDNEDDNVEM